MTVRVAQQVFGALLSKPYPLGRSERKLALYRTRLREIVQLLQT
ncbi:hypothetical protein [Mycetohabitans rhizoxinica]